jgi:hypothetical protein
MFNPSRDESRRFFIEAWRKQLAGEVLSPLEAMVAGIVALHPEYHALMASPQAALEEDFSPESGRTNPFLHLALHLAIDEQISIDQPRGIREAHRLMLEKHDDEHEARHALMAALAEMVWETQHRQRPFDADAYIANIRRAALK